MALQRLSIKAVCICQLSVHTDLVDFKVIQIFSSPAVLHYINLYLSGALMLTQQAHTHTSNLIKMVWLSAMCQGLAGIGVRHGEVGGVGAQIST